MLKIYKVPTYKIKPENCECIEASIDDIIIKLKKDYQYHERLTEDDKLIINIDIEYLDDFKNLLRNIKHYFTNRDLKVNITDICYTQNYGKLDKNGNKTTSYHITIPKYNCNSKTMKFMWEEFKSIYGYGHEVDTGHLGSKGKWMRLPNQSKEQKEGTEHKIIKGKIENFVLKYIPQYSKSVDDIFNNLIDKTFTKLEVKEIIKEEKNIENSPKNIKYDVNRLDMLKTENNKHAIELLKILKPTRFKEYNDWIRMGLIIYSLNIDNGAEIWDELSKQSGNYEIGACEKNYNGFRSKKFTIKTLYHYAKIDNPEGLNIIKKMIKTNDIDDYTSIQINKRYLTSDSELLDFYNNFDNNINKKCFCIKSTFDTGKTSFLLSIINRYKRILLVSFRKSFTYDIDKKFKQFGFNNYLEKNSYNSDRLIIQLESLLKLEQTNEVISENESECMVVPQYDLVILDEIVSILNQFSSDTIKSKSRETYDYLSNILLMSNKIIACDADFNNRPYAFLRNIFGSEKITVIHNNYVNNNKTLEILNNRDFFNDGIKEELDQNNKIIIISMTITDAEYYSKVITNIYPDKKIYLYTGNSDDTIKTKHLKNVNKYWEEADVIIYTSTIEAGVDYSVDEFNKIFSIIASDVASPRSFFQMLLRVRKISDNVISVLNPSNLPHKLNNFWTYNEVKDAYKETKSLQEKYEYITKGDKILKKRIIDNFDDVLIYNRVEELNKTRPFFMGYLLHIAEQKHFNIDMKQILEDNTIKNTFENKIENIINTLLQTDNISEKEYNFIIDLEKKNIATKEDKIKAEKYYYQELLGTKELTYDLLNAFYYHPYLIQNILYIIDTRNMNKLTGNDYDNELNKINVVKELIKGLGFSNIFDSKNIPYEIFSKNIKNVIENNYIFTDFTSSRILFNLDKKEKFNFKDTGHSIQYINSILRQYNIEISRNLLKGKNINKNYVYTLNFTNEIQIVLYNYITINKKIYDKNGILKRYFNKIH